MHTGIIQRDKETGRGKRQNGTKLIKVGCQKMANNKVHEAEQKTT